MRPVVAIFLFSVFFSLHAYGQRMTFENLTADDGLSQNSILAILQDNRGFIWFGTQHGLNKYDTRSFKVYLNDQQSSSISSNYVTTLLMDSRQRLWVGTRGGLNRYKPESDNFERIKLAGSSQNPANEVISCIYQDHAENVWVWSTDGLYMLGNKDNHFKNIQVPDSVNGLNGTNNHVVFQDRSGVYWLGSSAGLTRMIRSGNGFTLHRYKYNARMSGSLSDNYITSITEDAQSNLWIGTLHGGLNRYNRSANTFTRFLSNNGSQGPVSNNIRVLCPDNSGKIWIGTQAGLSILDPLTARFTSYTHDPEDKNSLSQNSIYSIATDRANSVWIGTYWGGADMVSIYNTSFSTYQTARYHSTINNNVVGSVKEDDQHNLWIGTEGGGLNYFNRKTDNVVTYTNKLNDPASVGSNLIKVVYIDRDKRVWVGTHGGGLNLFDPDKHNFRRFLYKENDPVTLGSEVLSILEDENKNYWIGTQNGLLIFKKYGDSLRFAANPVINKIGKKWVKTLVEDRSKNIWLGTSDGLYLYDRRQNSLKTFTIAQGLRSNDINCVFEDDRGRIWVGSYYGGLAFFDSNNGRFTSFTEAQGLANSNVVSILEDAGNNLWMGTGNGLSRFNIRTQVFKNYNKSDGLAGNTFNINSCFKTDDGEMLFGDYNGLNSFFPSKIADNNIPPPVVITGLKLFNKPVGINQPDHLISEDISLTKDITFSHSQNVFTIDFAALNYIKSDKNKYAYKLSGFDHEWVHTAIPSATYTNLSPGNYTFFAKGTNNDGTWGQPVTLQIRVLPVFWQTTWAYVLYVLFIGGLLILIARYFIMRSLLHRDHELTQLKLNFFTNISHEIRTHLSLIIGPVEKMLLFGKTDSESTKQLQLIKNKSDSLLHLVNELMDFRKAETRNLKLHVAEHNVVTFLQEIFASFYDLATARQIETDLSSSSQEILLYFDREQLEKVFFNLIHNAFKFTGSGGNISLSIEEKKTDVVITISDTGKGIAPESLKRLFENYFQEDDYGQQNTGYGIGLAIARSITELHGGAIVADSILSPSGNLTSFTVTLLRGKNHFSEEQLNAPVIQSAIPALIVPVVKAENLPGEVMEYDRPKSEKPLILIVEDNPDLRLFIRGFLERDYAIMESNNGSAGWTLATEHIPDLIISDVMMSEMDGFTLCGKLKADERTNHIPVILLTAKTSAPNFLNGLKMGADIYLTKPFSIEVLMLQIENLLKARERIMRNYNQQLKADHSNAGMMPLSRPGDNDEAERLLSSFDNEFLAKVIKTIENHLDNETFGVPMLASALAMSQPVLYKKLHALTGMSVNDFVKSVKMNRATILLKSRRYTINEIAYMLGFNDRKYFSKEFKKRYGKTPSEYAD